MDQDEPLDGQPSIRLNMSYREQKSSLRLSSIYGSFRFKTPVEVMPGDATELFCPHCDATVLADVPCDICSAPLGKLRLAVGGDVYFCSRRGCKAHKVEFVDLEKSLTELTRHVVPI